MIAIRIDTLSSGRKKTNPFKDWFSCARRIKFHRAKKIPNLVIQ